MVSIIVLGVLAGVSIARTIYKSDSQSTGGIVVYRSEKTALEEIPFKTISSPDPTLASGESKIAVVGKNGVKKVFYTVLEANGRETNRVKKSEQVLYPATDQVTVVGTKTTP